jgi:cyclohexanone monooxygenase
VDWTAECIEYLRERRLETIDPTVEAENDWGDHVNEEAHATLYPTAGSWYMGANIAGKPRVFLPYIGGVGRYRTRCAEVATNGYEGFALS